MLLVLILNYFFLLLPYFKLVSHTNVFILLL